MRYCLSSFSINIITVKNGNLTQRGDGEFATEK